MLIPLGFLAASGGVSSDFVLLDSRVLTSAEASVTFSSLGSYSGTYKHLQIRWSLRSNRAFNGDIMAIQLNNDTAGGNYAYHWLAGSGSAVNSGGEANSNLITYVKAANSTADAFSGGVTDVLDAFQTKNKTMRHFFDGADDRQLVLASTLWKNTASITDITFRPLVGTAWLTHSRFSLYGIKG
jgi:hypothetical protein